MQVCSDGIQTYPKSDRDASYTGTLWRALDKPLQEQAVSPVIKSLFHLQSELTDWLLDDRRPEGCRLESFEPLLNWVISIDAPQTPPYLYRGQTFRYTVIPYPQMSKIQATIPQKASAY